MDLCPDSVGGGWKTKTESLTRELGKNLKTWCWSKSAVIQYTEGFQAAWFWKAPLFQVP